MEERRITVRPVRNDIASCRVCHARNYESRYIQNGDKIEENIMEIEIGDANGATIVCMCPDCLEKLIEEGNEALDSLRKPDIFF